MTALRELRGGTVVEVETPAAHALIALQGAQVLSWTPSHATADVFWCSSLAKFGGGGAIRGGVPICWPWFGPHPSDASKPQHGWARNLPWRLEASDVVDGATRLVFSFEHPESGLAATMSMRVGATLELELTSRSTADVSVPMSVALHPYFAVSDVQAIELTGLDGADALDLDAKRTITVDAQPLRFNGTRTWRFDHAPPVQIIEDPGFKRRITIERRGGASAIVWHPGEAAARMADIPAAEAQRFVCVESGDVGAARLSLAPGATHTIAVRYTVSAR